MTAASLISMFMVPFNKAIIARFIGLREVTYFEIANRSIMQFRSLFETGLRAIMPEISKISAITESAKDKVDTVLKKSMKLVFYAGVPAFMLLFFLAPILLDIWLGEQYVPQISNALRILLVGYMANLLIIPIYYLFMGIGKVGYCFISHLFQSILNVVAISVFLVFAVAGFYLFVCIYSSSIGLSSLLVMLLFFVYVNPEIKKRHENKQSYANFGRLL